MRSRRPCGLLPRASDRRKVPSHAAHHVWGTASGLNRARLVGQAVLDVITTDGTYRSAFACEKEPWKAAFISSYVHQFLLREEDPACVFSNIQDLGASRAHCHTHDKTCTVPGPCTGHNITLAIAGFSCKDLSKLGRAYSEMKQCLKTGEGSSGQTLAGLLSYLSAHKVGAYLGENVDELEDHNSSNRVHMDEAPPLPPTSSPC